MLQEELSHENMVIDRPNCNSDKVDEIKGYSLDKNFTHKKPTGFCLEGKEYSVKQWNELLIKACEILNKKILLYFNHFPIMNQ